MNSFNEIDSGDWMLLISIAFIMGLLISGLVFWLWSKIAQKNSLLQLDVDLANAGLAENERIDTLSRSYELTLSDQRSRIATLEAQLKADKSLLEKQDQAISTLKKIEDDYLRLETRYQEQSDRLESERSLLSETKEKLFKEFELSASKIFDEKHKSFQSASKTNIELVLNPFKQQLQDFNVKIDSVYNQESSQRNQLVGQIVELQKQTQQISVDANNLVSALKGDNKVQGDWGEIVLERLLEQSGLSKGREYELQNTLKNTDGRIVRPDVIVHLPDKKDIVIDSKMSLKDYEKYSTETDANQKAQYLARHVESLRKHIRGLSEKKYEQIENLRTLDFVFIFVPIEAAYLSAMESSPGLFKEAYEKNIVLVSPSSLMVALRTVETIWRYEKQNKNAEKIAASAGKLYDQFVLVMESLDALGGHIDKASDAYTKVFKRFTSGKGNLLGRVDRLKDLGAKTSKTLSDGLQSELDGQEDELDGQEGRCDLAPTPSPKKITEVID